MTRLMASPILVAALLAAALHTPSPASHRCLAIGFGIWSLHRVDEDDVLARSRLVELLNRTPDYTPTFYGLSGWQEALIDDGKSASEYDHEWVWVAPVADSLYLLRPAIMSAGISLDGKWHHDTLRGRAESFGDAVISGAPGQRANGFGVRYRCRDRDAATRAQAAVASLRAKDVPDTARNAFEDSVEFARRARLLPRPSPQ